MKGPSFVRHAAVYGAANLLLQAGGFVLLPLYTRCLGPEDFGALEVLVRLGETMATFLLLGGLRQALLRFYQQSDSEDEKARVVSAALALVVGCVAAGGAVVFAFAGPLNDALRARGHDLGAGLLRLAVLGVLLEPLTLVPLTLLQARLESLSYVAVTLGQFLLRVILSIVFVAWLGWGVAGVLLATALTAGLLGVGLSVREGWRYAAWPDLRRVGEILRFALPFLPGGLCFFMLHHGDRFFLLYWHGTAAVGTYALGYKLAMTVGMFTLAPLHMVWGARMYQVARQDDAPAAFGRVFSRVLGLYLFAGLGLCLFAPEAVALLGGRGYAAAVPIVLPVVLACFCQAGATLMDAGFYVRGRPGLKLVVTLATTAVMLGLYVLLIPPLGGMGAALATLVGFAFLAAGTYVVSQRVFPVRYEWGRLAGMLALAAALYLPALALPAAGWTAPLRAALWLLAPALAWRGGLVSDEEKGQVAALLRDAAALLASRERQRPEEATPVADAPGSP
jgi:O-antigen/teichoic acid export membrane protein